MSKVLLGLNIVLILGISFLMWGYFDSRGRIDENYHYAHELSNIEVNKISLPHLILDEQSYWNEFVNFGGIADKADNLIEDKNLHLLIFKAEGKHFSAGADVGEHTKEKCQEMIPEFMKLFFQLDQINKVIF